MITSAQKLLMASAGGSVEVDNSWNLSATQDYGWVGSNFITSSQDTLAEGLFMKPDGTKMYVVGRQNKNVYEYNLSSAWDTSTASYSQLFSVSSQDTSPLGVFFKDDGTKMFVVGAIGDDVNEYSLSTAWDISTATYTTNFSVASQATVPTDLFIGSSGTKMYVIGQTSDSVHEYDLSTAWDVSSATFNQTFSVATQETVPTGLFFKSDGTKMFVVGSNGDDINEYNLTTAWDISTASFSQVSVKINSYTQTKGVPVSLSFKSDGTKVFVASAFGGSRVVQYNLSTAWDISTLSWIAPTEDYFDVSSQEDVSNDLFFKPDGTKVYVIGNRGDDVNEYDLSTAWDINSASFLQKQSVIDARPLGMFFKDDGTKMYITGDSGNNIRQYSLSTAWDVSSATSDSVTLSVGTQESRPSGLFIGDSGTELYIAGYNSDAVQRYTLSTAWDLSSGSHSQTLSVSAYDTTPRGVFFKPDGTKMYLSGTTDHVQEFLLSTAWDLSTATHNHEYTGTSEVFSNMTGIYWKPDGYKFWAIGNSVNVIAGFNLA